MKIFVGFYECVVNDTLVEKSINYDAETMKLLICYNGKCEKQITLIDYPGAPTFPVADTTLITLLRQHKASGVIMFDGGYLTLDEDSELTANYYKYAGMSAMLYSSLPYTISDVQADSNTNQTFIGIRTAQSGNYVLDICYNHEDEEIEILNKNGRRRYILHNIHYEGIPTVPIKRDMVAKLAATRRRQRGVIFSVDGFIILDESGPDLASYYKYEDVATCVDVQPYAVIVP